MYHFDGKFKRKPIQSLGGKREVVIYSTCFECLFDER